MRTPRTHALAARSQLAFALLVITCLTIGDRLQHRWQQARASGDSGSETVEKAVLVAVVLGLAVGLAAAISAVVGDYSKQIKP